MNKNPKYDNDLVTLGYLKNTFDSDNKDSTELAKYINKGYASPPVPPYVEGSILYYQHSIYRCKKSRSIGTFNWDDWALVGTDDSHFTTWVDNTYTDDIAEIQEQIDKRVETYYQSDDPSTDWTTDLVKARHVGDLWYNTTNNTEWRWSKYDTNPITYGWRHINVPDAVFDLIDTKKSIYVSKPTTYNENDMWIIEDDLPDADLPEGTVENPIVRGDWVFATQDSTTYDKTHWVKLDEDITLEYLQENYDTTAEVEAKIATAKSESYTEAYNLVDTQKGRIDLVVRNVTDVGNPNSLVNRVDSLEGAISDIADITITGESIEATVDLDNVIASEPVVIKIHPITDNISYLYPRANLYPNSNLYMTTRTVRFTNKKEYELTEDTKYTSFRKYYSKSGDVYTLLVAGTDYIVGNTITGSIYQNKYIDYELPDDLLYYDSENYDEFALDYNSTSCYINKKCEYNADGTVALLDTPTTDDYSSSYPLIDLTSGDYTVSLLGYTTGYIFVRLMSNNIYTDQFYTKVQTVAKINLKADEISESVNQTLTGYSTTTQMNTAITQKIQDNNNAYVDIEVAKKVNNTDYTKASIVAKINDNTSQVQIAADKVNLSGYLTISSAQSTYETQSNASSTYASKSGLAGGTTTVNGGCITTSSITTDKIAASAITSDKINSGAVTADKIAAGSISASKVSSDIITTSNFSAQNLNANNITGGTINADRIAAGSISGAKIADSTITNAKIHDINASKITAGTISTSRLSSSVITTSNFSSQNIKAENITTGTLNGIPIKNGTYTFSKGSQQLIISTRYSYGIFTLWSGNTIRAVIDSGTFYAYNSSGSLGAYLNSSGIHTSSDIRYKKHIKNIEQRKSIDIITNLTPIEYDYNEKRKHRGLSAQEVKKVLNNNGYKNQVYDTEKDGKYTLNYIELIPDLINCIKYQQDEINKLKNEINKLKESGK